MFDASVCQCKCLSAFNRKAPSAVGVLCIDLALFLGDVLYVRGILCIRGSEVNTHTNSILNSSITLRYIVHSCSCVNKKKREAGYRRKKNNCLILSECFVHDVNERYAILCTKNYHSNVKGVRGILGEEERTMNWGELMDGRGR